MKLLTEDRVDIRRPHWRLSGTSESELAGRVRRFLNERVPGADEVVVDATSGTVALRGKVPSPRAKQLCLQCSRHVAGVIHVINELDVIDEPGVAEPKWRTRPR